MTENLSATPETQPAGRDASRLWHLLMVLVAALAFRLTPPCVHFSAQPEPPRAMLSNYLVDTEFLTRCATAHGKLIARTEVLAPEIRSAILQLAMARATGE